MVVEGDIGFPDALISKGLRPRSFTPFTRACSFPDALISKGLRHGHRNGSWGVFRFPDALISKGLRHCAIGESGRGQVGFPDALISKGLRLHRTVGPLLVCVFPRRPDFKGIKTAMPLVHVDSDIVSQTP